MNINQKKSALALLLYPALSLSLTLTACTPQAQLLSTASKTSPALETEQVSFTYRLPQRFKTQVVQPDAVKYILLSLTGEGIDGTLINREGLVEVVDNTATAVINDVPLAAGSIRVVTAQGYDAEKQALPAFLGKGYYTSRSGQVNVNVRIDRRGLLMGQILEHFIKSEPEKVQGLSLKTLGTLMDQMTGFNPETSQFATDPTLFDPVGIAQELSTNPDATLSELQDKVTATAGELTLSIQTKGGGVFTESLLLRINDPNSTEANIAGDATSPQVPDLDVSQGAWTVTLLKQNGTVLGSTSIRVDAQGNVTLGQNVLTLQLQPRVTHLSRETLPVAGNVQTVLTGTGFTDASAVSFGTTDAINFTVDSDTQITATVPAMAAGNAYVTVTTPGGVSDIGTDSQVTYLNAPTLTQLSPDSGVITQTITLTGTYFDAIHGNNTVRFGETTAVSVNGSNVSLTVAVPAGVSGVVPVTVSSNQQTSSALNFSVVPSITSLGATTGSSTGGSTVVITGSGFTGATAVKFGSTDATAFTVDSNTQITATSPSGNIGPVNITVTTPGGTSGNSAANRFTYQADFTSATFAGSSGGFADGSGANAQFNFPWGIARDSNNHLFVSDYSNNSVRQITPAGLVSTLAGSLTQESGATNGTGTDARFKGPRFIATDADDNLYLSEVDNYQVRKITPAGVVTLLAGSTFGDVDATGANAQFGSLQGIGLDQSQNVYVVDGSAKKIKKITQAGVVTTYAGSGGTGADNGSASTATFSGDMRGLAVDVNNNVYVADTGNNCIRKIDANTQLVSTLAGMCGSSGNTDGTGTAARFSSISGLAFDGNGDLWVTGLQRLRKITPAGVVTSPKTTGESLSYIVDLVFDDSGHLYLTDYNQKIMKLTPPAP